MRCEQCGGCQVGACSGCSARHGCAAVGVLGGECAAWLQSSRGCGRAGSSQQCGGEGWKRPLLHFAVRVAVAVAVAVAVVGWLRCRNCVAAAGRSARRVVAASIRLGRRSGLGTLRRTAELGQETKQRPETAHSAHSQPQHRARSKRERCTAVQAAGLSGSLGRSLECASSVCDSAHFFLGPAAALSASEPADYSAASGAAHSTVSGAWCSCCACATALSELEDDRRGVAGGAVKDGISGSVC